MHSALQSTGRQICIPIENQHFKDKRTLHEHWAHYSLLSSVSSLKDLKAEIIVKLIWKRLFVFIYPKPFSTNNAQTIVCQCQANYPSVAYVLTLFLINFWFLISLYFPLGFIFGSPLRLWSHKLFQTWNGLESLYLQKSDTLHTLFLEGDCSFFKWTSALHCLGNSLYLMTNAVWEQGCQGCALRMLAYS